MPTGLRHIEEGRLPESALQQMCTNFGVGPLSIQVCVDLSNLTATASVSLLGVNLGTVVLTPNNSSVTLGGSVDGFKAEVTIQVDFGTGAVAVTAELCAPFVGCKDYSWSTTLTTSA